MINVVRIILLIIALGVISLAGFYFYKVQNNEVETGKIKVKIMEKGVDLEIENFKVTHEVNGNKEWILKAVLAQVNNQENVTNLKGVEVIIPKGQNQPYVITAESGTYQKTSKDIDLAGHVKLTGDVQSLAERFHTKKPKPSNTSLSQEKK
jgi:LPS export ABC transporter protein LptC